MTKPRPLGNNAKAALEDIKFGAMSGFREIEPLFKDGRKFTEAEILRRLAVTGNELLKIAQKATEVLQQ